MTRAWTVHQPPIVTSLESALVMLASVITLIAASQLAAFLGAGGPEPWLAVSIVAGALVYAASGLIAWWRRPGNRLGLVMVAGGVIWLLNALVFASQPLLVAVGVVTATLPLGVIVHLLLVFPSGRLRSTLARWTVIAGYAVCLVLQIPLYLWAPAASPDGMLAMADRPELVTVGSRVQTGAGMCVMAITAVVLSVRFHRASERRSVLGPLYVYGVAVVLLVPLVPIVVRSMTGFDSSIATAGQIVLLVVAPMLFAVAMMRGGFARTGELEQLGEWLGSAAGDRPDLGTALATALGDDSVQLSYWLHDRGGYVDADGRSVTAPTAGNGRGLAEIGVGGRRVGGIFYDRNLIADPELVNSAGRVIAIAVDQQRLTVQLRASRRALQQSRARIVEASDRERRRIAQNLHDGLQAELVLLSVEAQRLAGTEAGTSPEERAQAAERLRWRIDHAAAGLRDLVYAVMPAPLVEQGLGPAIEDLVDRMPVPTTLEMSVDRNLPDAVQATAYFVMAEALNNAARHAGARHIAVRLTDRAGVLVIRVDDDGIGNAHPAGGFGLTGLQDRVEVLGGTLRIDSPVDHGTHITAELPCPAALGV